MSLKSDSHFSNIGATIVQFYYTFRANFWFIPALIIVGAFILASISLRLDAGDFDNLSRWSSFLPIVSVDGGRQIVSLVAGSVITVASLVFSLTFVALSMMSEQLGPRLLIFFMTDRPIQMVIGFFIGTFFYALLVLVSIGVGETGGFVPILSIYITAILAIIAFVLVVYFLHHIAQSVQADKVAARLGNDLKTALESVIIDSTDTAVDSGNDHKDLSNSQVENIDGDKLLAAVSGYIQFIDYDTAAKIAEENDLIVQYSCRPGHFVIANTETACVKDLRNLDEDVVKCLQDTIRTGEKRTPAQHAEFELNALVEVALRALSPGINDPFTAKSCINHITDGLARIVTSRLKLQTMFDEDNQLRVVKYPQTFAHFLDAAFHPLREYGRSSMFVFLHICYSMEKLTELVVRDDDILSLVQHVDLLEKDLSVVQFSKPDLDHIGNKLKSLREQLNQKLEMLLTI